MIAAIPADRVFTDDGCDRSFARVRASAKKRNCKVAWVRQRHVGPTGKPYAVRRLAAITEEGTVHAVAHVDRADRVRWHEVSGNERIEIE